MNKQTTKRILIEEDVHNYEPIIQEPAPQIVEDKYDRPMISFNSQTEGNQYKTD